MGQTYHNFITLSGPVVDRLQATKEALDLNMPKSNWEWMEIQVEAKDERCRDGRDDQHTRWDFYSRNFPLRLDELSAKYSSLLFDCYFLDITAEVIHIFKLQNNCTWDDEEKPVVWSSEVADEEATIEDDSVVPPSMARSLSADPQGDGSK